MKVRTLIKQLEKLKNKDADIILQKDPEGNGYSPIEGADHLAVYTKDYDVYDTRWTHEGACMEEDEWKEFKKTQKPCVVLFPKY
jgi:hypothetical protein